MNKLVKALHGLGDELVTARSLGQSPRELLSEHIGRMLKGDIWYKDPLRFAMLLCNYISPNSNIFLKMSVVPESIDFVIDGVAHTLRLIGVGANKACFEFDDGVEKRVIKIFKAQIDSQERTFKLYNRFVERRAFISGYISEFLIEESIQEVSMVQGGMEVSIPVIVGMFGEGDPLGNFLDQQSMSQAILAYGIKDDFIRFVDGVEKCMLETGKVIEILKDNVLISQGSLVLVDTDGLMGIKSVLKNRMKRKSLSLILQVRDCLKGIES